MSRNENKQCLYIFIKGIKKDQQCITKSKNDYCAKHISNEKIKINNKIMTDENGLNFKQDMFINNDNDNEIIEEEEQPKKIFKSTTIIKKRENYYSNIESLNNDNEIIEEEQPKKIFKSITRKTIFQPINLIEEKEEEEFLNIQINEDEDLDLDDDEIKEEIIISKEQLEEQKKIRKLNFGYEENSINLKYCIKQKLATAKIDYKYFNNDIEFFEAMKKINFQFHQVNNQDDNNNINKCLYFDIDNTNLNEKQIKDLINDLLKEQFNLNNLIPKIHIDKRTKKDLFSYHVHVNNMKTTPNNLKLAIKDYIKKNEEYKNILDHQIYGKFSSLRYAMCQKDNEFLDNKFRPIDLNINFHDFFKTIFGYTNDAHLIHLKPIIEDNTNFIINENSDEIITIEKFTKYKQFVEKMINDKFNIKLIGPENYTFYMTICYTIAAMSGCDNRILIKMKNILVNLGYRDNNKMVVLINCFNYNKCNNFVLKSKVCYNILINYINSINAVGITSHKDIRMRNAINHYVSQAGLGKSNNIIDNFFHTNIFDDTRNYLVITPRIINRDDIKNKFIQRSKGLFIDFDNYTIEDFKNKKGVVINLIAGIDLKYINKKFIQFNNELKIEKLSDDHIFNNDIKIVICTTDKSLYKVLEYTKTNSIYFQNLIIDEHKQVIENLQTCPKSLINSNDMSTYLYNLINFTENVFLSDIYNILIDNLYPDRIINSISKDIIEIKKTNPNFKYMSYSKILVSNQQKDFDNIIKNNSFFIWADLNITCQKLFKYMLDVIGIDKNELVCLTSHNIWDDSLLKYKYIIASPKIFSCISIGLEDNFDRKVIAIIRGNHISNYDIINSIQRVRKCNELNIFINDVNRTIKQPKLVNYLYDNEIDTKLNNLIKKYNDLTLTQMIDSLIKNEDYIYSENFDNENKLEFKNIDFIIQKPTTDLSNKQIEYLDNNFKEDIIENNDNNNEKNNDIDYIINQNIINEQLLNDKIIDIIYNLNKNDKDLKFVYNKYKDIKFLKELNNEYLFNILCSFNIIDKNIIFDNDNKIILKDINDYITNFEKFCSTDILTCFKYKLTNIQNVNIKTLKKFINKNTDIKNFKSFGIFNQHNDIIKNTNKIKFQDANRYIKKFKNNFNNLTHEEKLNLLNDIKSNNFDFGKDKELNKQIINNMIIKQEDKILKLDKLNIINIENYINSLKNDDSLKVELLKCYDKNYYTRNCLKELIKRKVFNNCLNYQIKYDENKNPILYNNIKFDIDWNIELLNTKEIDNYFRKFDKKINILDILNKE